MPKVTAKCLMPAWDSNACIFYEPNKGPLPDGMYEIESGSKLDDLKTPTGQWIFQYPGHENEPQTKDTRIIAPVTMPDPLPEPEAKEVKVDGRKGKRSAEFKAKALAAREARRAERLARLETVEA